MSIFGSPFASAIGSGYLFIADSGGTPLSALSQSPGGFIPGALDMLIDPVTLDYVETENGEFAETADSRTTMLIQLEIEFGTSAFDHLDGTRLAEMRRAGDVITPEIVQSEILRSGGILVTAGIVSDLRVAIRDDRGEVLRDASERFQPRLSWRDLASGSPVDNVLIGG